MFVWECLLHLEFRNGLSNLANHASTFVPQHHVLVAVILYWSATFGVVKGFNHLPDRYYRSRCT